MFKGYITPTSNVVVNTNIPISQVLNTNSKVSFDTVNNTLNIYTAGIWDINALVNFTASTTGSLTIQLYNNGVAIPNAFATLDVVTGDSYSVFIPDEALVVNTFENTHPSISIRANDAITTVGGTLTVSYKN